MNMSNDKPGQDPTLDDTAGDIPTEHIEFSDRDEAELHRLGITTGDEPSFHPILEVWQKVIHPAHEEQKAKITPQYANRIMASYRGVDFPDMPEVARRFYSKVIELEEILAEVIASDEDCLTYTTPEEDVEHNSRHYRTVLLEWQKRFLSWELEWDTTDPNAGVEMAAISEVHSFFFGQQGITAFLQNIQFQYTEQDQAEVSSELEAMKEEASSE